MVVGVFFFSSGYVTCVVSSCGTGDVAGVGVYTLIGLCMPSVVSSPPSSALIFSM